MGPRSRSVLSAVLLSVPVVAEATHLIGDQLWGEVLFALSQVAGWALVLSVVGSLAAAVEAGRWGPRLVRTGVVLQLLFGVLYLGTLVADLEPDGPVFLPFLLGFLALTVGGLVWARALRRTAARTAGTGLLGVAVLGFAAIAVGSDPFHDVALVGSYLAWVLVGRGIGRPAYSLPAGRVSASSR